MLAMLLALSMHTSHNAYHEPLVTGFTTTAPAQEDSLAFYCPTDGNGYCGDSIVQIGPCVIYPDGASVCKWGSLRFFANYPDVYGVTK